MYTTLHVNQREHSYMLSGCFRSLFVVLILSSLGIDFYIIMFDLSLLAQFQIGFFYSNIVVYNKMYVPTYYTRTCSKLKIILFSTYRFLLYNQKYVLYNDMCYSYHTRTLHHIIIYMLNFKRFERLMVGFIILLCTL